MDVAQFGRSAAAEVGLGWGLKVRAFLGIKISLRDQRAPASQNICANLSRTLDKNRGNLLKYSRFPACSLQRQPSTLEVRAEHDRTKDQDSVLDFTVLIPYTGRNGKHAEKYAIASSDTGSRVGNWISLDLVKSLNKMDLVELLDQAFDVATGGGPITVRQSIKIQFKMRDGKRYHDCECFIFPPETIPVFDLLLGSEFLLKHNVCKIEPKALYPLVSRDSPGRVEKAQMIDARKTVRREQEDIEVRRRQANASQHQGSQQQQQQGQGQQQ